MPSEDKKDTPTKVKREDVAATIAKCAKTDIDKFWTTAGLVTDKYNEGKRGNAVVDGITSLSANVGTCVAAAYEDKKPDIFDRATTWVKGLTNQFSSAAEGVKPNMNTATHLVREVTNTIAPGGLDSAKELRGGASGVPNTPAAKL